MRIKGVHSYDNIGRILSEVIEYYTNGNPAKVVSVVTDNGSNFAKAFRVSYHQIILFIRLPISITYFVLIIIFIVIHSLILYNNFFILGVLSTSETFS
jgi:hypothetical protein